MVEVYAQVVLRADSRGNAPVVSYTVLSHPGVASRTVLTTVGLKCPQQCCTDRTGGVRPSGRAQRMFVLLRDPYSQAL